MSELKKGDRVEIVGVEPVGLAGYTVALLHDAGKATT